MIEKSLPVLQEMESVLHLTAESLQRDYSLCTFHLREDGRGLVVAEGAVRADSAENASGIDVADGDLYLYRAGEGTLQKWQEEESYSGIPEVHRILRAWDESGRRSIFCVTTDSVFKLHYGNTEGVTCLQGGSSAALHAERIFLADENTLYYSAPLDTDCWEEERGKAGYVQLLNGAGEILSLQPYKERLCCFRREGITVLRILGDELNFRAVQMPYGCGTMLKNSVAPCGDNILFFTRTGAYLYNGARCIAAKNARFEEIDCTQPMKAVCCQGRYYALVTHVLHGKMLYCYDPLRECAHFICCPADDLAAGEELFFLRENGLWKLTACGMPPAGQCEALFSDVAFSVNGSKTLRRFALEGRGSFTVEITSQNGTRTLTGSAGQVLTLRSPLKGNGFSFRITTEDEAFRLTAVDLRFTEEDDGN